MSEALQRAQRRLIDAMADGRGEGVELRLLEAVLDRALLMVPGLIQERVPDVDAVILSQAEVRRMLTDFAIDLVAVEVGLLREHASTGSGGSHSDV